MEQMSLAFFFFKLEHNILKFLYRIAFWKNIFLFFPREFCQCRILIFVAEKLSLRKSYVETQEILRITLVYLFLQYKEIYSWKIFVNFLIFRGTLENLRSVLRHTRWKLLVYEDGGFKPYLKSSALEHRLYVLIYTSFHFNPAFFLKWKYLFIWYVVLFIH